MDIEVRGVHLRVYVCVSVSVHGECCEHTVKRQYMYIFKRCYIYTRTTHTPKRAAAAERVQRWIMSSLLNQCLQYRMEFHMFDSIRYAIEWKINTEKRHGSLAVWMCTAIRHDEVMHNRQRGERKRDIAFLTLSSDMIHYPSPSHSHLCSIAHSAVTSVDTAPCTRKINKYKCIRSRCSSMQCPKWMSSMTQWHCSRIQLPMNVAKFESIQNSTCIFKNEFCWISFH